MHADTPFKNDALNPSLHQRGERRHRRPDRLDSGAGAFEGVGQFICACFASGDVAIITGPAARVENTRAVDGAQSAVENHSRERPRPVDVPPPSTTDHRRGVCRPDGDGVDLRSLMMRMTRGSN